MNNWETNPDAGKIGRTAFQAFCYEHDRIETTNSCKFQMMMQLACGLLTYEGRVIIFSHVWDPVMDSNGKKIGIHRFHGKLLRSLRRNFVNITTGSHRCGNGQIGGKSGVPVRCFNLFCTIREPQTENDARVACHTRFAEQAGAGVDETEMSCFCAPGIEIPCTVGRSHLTRLDLQSVFARHLRSIRDERDEKNNRKNGLGKCRYEGCGFKVLQACNLNTHFDIDSVDKFVSHFDLMHERGMEKLDGLLQQ
jgi:hypothetical protein